MKKYIKSSEDTHLYKCYHTSRTPIAEFNVNQSKEIGLHCGTPITVKYLHYKYLYYIELDINPNETFRLIEDVGSRYYTSETLRLFYKSGIMDTDEYEFRRDEIRKYHNILSKYYRDMLLSKGYKSFTYMNDQEIVNAPQESICVFSNDIIKKFDEISWGDI